MQSCRPGRVHVIFEANNDSWVTLFWWWCVVKCLDNANVEDAPAHKDGAHHAILIKNYQGGFGFKPLNPKPAFKDGAHNRPKISGTMYRTGEIHCTY